MIHQNNDLRNRGSISRLAIARSRNRDRRAAVLVGVLACMIVGMILTALTVQAALRGRREARLELQLTQTEWLCEGGIVRAVSELRKSTEYSGETWHPELKIEPWQAAEVEIEVKKSETTGEQTEWQIRVCARLDSTTDLDGPMQRTRTLSIH